MTTPLPTDSVLSLGSPRFGDARLADLARAQGIQAAWLQAVAKDPASAAAGVTGDFAVGLQDAAGRTFLAVDRFAIRTLCYRVQDGRLRFAARADELADAGTPLELQALFDYVYFHAIPSPRTVFQGVHRLPPGHYALFENGKLTVAPYWQPRFEEPRRPSFDALREEFLSLLGQSVAGQLDGSKPACFLSGGTDSSTVAGMIGKVGSQPAASYSIGFEAQGYDEMEYARIASRHFKTEHHEYYVTPDDLVRSIGDAARHFDQPFGNSSAVPAYYCAKMAREDGVTRLLAGDGGDELFGGNSRYAKQRLFNLYYKLPGAARKGLMEPVLGLKAAGSIPLVKKAASYVEQARVPLPARLQMYNLLERLGTGSVFTPDFLAAIDQASPGRQQQQVWDMAPADSGLLNQQLAFDWRYTLAENDLPKVLGSTQMAGVEVGFPFLSDALLEFSLRLPVEYKLKGLQLRWFFKEALRGFLPPEIITKKKHGFGLPFGVWATQHQALRALAADSLRSLAQRNVVQPAFIDALLTRHLPEHPGYYGEMVWILMMLEQWMRGASPRFRL